MKADKSPHSAYNLGSAPVSLKQMAEAVKKLIPDAQITFGTEPESCELPWKVNCDRAKQDFGFNILSLDDAILMHANEARADAGLPPLKA